ncbi:unnamed protein product, partial [Darwinula stevensoni]
FVANVFYLDPLLFSLLILAGVPPFTVIVSGEMQRSERRSKRQSMPLLKVLGLHEPPYLMRSGEDYETNTKYEGFLVDMLDQLGNLVGFEYEIDMVKDGNYGSYNNATQTWNGLIGGIIAGEADLAAAPLTITSGRSDAVVFSKPWMYTGISILYKHLPVDSGSGWMFLRPFTLSTWIAVAIMYVAVSLAYWVVARCSPEERRRSTESGEPVFGIFNTFWAAFTPLLLRGNQEMPQALSTRLLTGIWWSFSFLILVLYSSMVAKEFTTGHYRPKVSSWKDLADRAVNFGAIKGGSTQRYFKTSQIPEYQKIAEYLASHPELSSSNLDEGVDRVLKNPPCSNWTDKVNKGILQLQEQGALQALYMKYWKDRSKCPDTTKQFDQPQLDLPHLGGIFVALGISIFLALLIAFVEVFLYVRKRDLTQSLREALVGEFRQIFGLAGSLPSDRQVLTENSS